VSYSDLLRDPRWQKKRLEVLERENFACEQCEDASTELHVHHTYYAKGRKPWEYDAADLRCLCKPCHERVTEKTAELHRLLGECDEGSFDIILGLVRMLVAYGNDAPRVRVESYEVAMGVGLFHVLPADAVIGRVAEDGWVDREVLRVAADELAEKRRPRA
jgi:hypothetical protein